MGWGAGRGAGWGVRWRMVRGGGRGKQSVVVFRVQSLGLPAREVPQPAGDPKRSTTPAPTQPRMQILILSLIRRSPQIKLQIRCCRRPRRGRRPRRRSQRRRPAEPAQAGGTDAADDLRGVFGIFDAGVEFEVKVHDVPVVVWVGRGGGQEVDERVFVHFGEVEVEVEVEVLDLGVVSVRECRLEEEFSRRPGVS